MTRKSMIKAEAIITNAKRAAWAQVALTAFMQASKVRADNAEDAVDAIPDLVCNLLHLARKRRLAPALVLARAMSNFKAEERGE